MTIPTYSKINDSEIDNGSPVTMQLFEKIRNNLLAAFSGDPSTNDLTTETDINKVLKPDGAGGVTWGFITATGAGNIDFSSTSEIDTNKILIPNGIGGIAWGVNKFVGETFSFPGIFPVIPGFEFMLCTGTSLLRAEYPILFSALGGTSSPFGFADSSHFNIPDYRGRTLIGSGTGSGLSARVLGATGGEETHVLSVNEMPSHNHTIDISTNNTGSGNSQWGIGTQIAEQTTTNSTGSNAAHNNMQPFAVTNIYIRAR
jgi:microcystin-dependent protein